MPEFTTAQRLKQIMEERNLKQIDIINLAKPFCEKYKLKIGRNDLSQYISGKVVPRQNKTFILAKALNVNEAWLMGYDVDRAPQNTETEVFFLTIGERVKARRIELGLSVDMLAEKINKNRATIYRYESNEIENMSIITLEPLAEALNTTPAYLMGWENSVGVSIEKTFDNFNFASDINILNKYNKLNNNGQIKAESYIDGLLENPNYVKKKERPVTDNGPSEKIKLIARNGQEVNEEEFKRNIGNTDDLDDADDL